MLKDADPNYFSGIFIVCGYTGLRHEIDSLWDYPYEDDR